MILMVILSNLYRYRIEFEDSKYAELCFYSWFIRYFSGAVSWLNGIDVRSIISVFVEYS